MWMMPLHLNVNKKFDYDYDDNDDDDDSCLPKKSRDPDQTASEEAVLQKQSDQGLACLLL